jgi:hypothetical protein
MRLHHNHVGDTTSYRRNQPLAEADIRCLAPSVFATEPHDSRSQRYTYIPTMTVLDGLANEGFQVFSAQQSRCRDLSRQDYTKHMLRLRHPSAVALNQEFAEIVLVNSHDGSSAYKIYPGWFRLLCWNGLIVGDTGPTITVQHKGNVTDAVVEGAYEVLGYAERVGDKRNQMAAVALETPEQQAFAEAALQLRWPEHPPITPEQALRPQRHADAGDDLWRTFNRVQENLLRGGQDGRTANNGRRRTRPIRGIDQTVAVNRALWTLTERMAELKAAA